LEKRGFSLYDIELFLREAGAEKINANAVISLEKELESTLNDLLEDAELYANYAGRSRLIKASDIKLAAGKGMGKKRPIFYNGISRKHVKRVKKKFSVIEVRQT